MCFGNELHNMKITGGRMSPEETNEIFGTSSVSNYIAFEVLHPQIH